MGVQLARGYRSSQIKLHAIAHTVVFEGQLVLERTFTLAFEKNFVRFTPNPSCDLGFEKLCFGISPVLFVSWIENLEKGNTYL